MSILKEALLPFARFAMLFDDDRKDEEVVSFFPGKRDEETSVLTVGDFRRAEEALKTEREEAVLVDPDEDDGIATVCIECGEPLDETDSLSMESGYCSEACHLASLGEGG